MKVAVIDDERQERVRMKEYFDRFGKENDQRFQVECYENGDALLAVFEKDQYALLVFDIDMPGRSGIETARLIREKDEDVTILFVTNMAQYAINGYEVQAVDYIIKPETDVCPDYQFLSTDLAMLCRMDSRFTIDMSLTLDGAGAYSLVSDAYVIEAGKRAEIGDPSGLGIVCRTTSEGTYVTNEDGTVTTSPAEHVKFELHTDTYSAQMKDLMAIDMNGSNEDGEYDSNDFPVILDYFPETIWTVSGSELTTYKKAEDASEGSTGTTAEAAAEEEPAPAAGFEVASDDGATKMIFGADGTYKFVFEQYGIEDAGTYTFADGVLTLVDANGKETVAEGDPLKLHYEYSQSNQLTGDFTIPAADLQ